jgi:hypothetical protein
VSPHAGFGRLSEFNLDGIGGVNGMINNTVVCERDETSPPSTNNEASAKITNELANCVSLYTDLTPEIGYAFASDYMPFEFHNKVITGLYEKNINPNYHSPDDLISNMDVEYLYHVTQAAIGASLHFSGALDSTTRVIEKNFFSETAVYPNPTSGEISVHLGKIIPAINVCVRNTLGQLVFEKKIESTDHLEIDLGNCPAGIYFLELELPLGESKVIKLLKE